MNSPIYNMRPRRQSGIPTVIFILLIVNGLVFAAQQLNPDWTRYFMALWPLSDGDRATYAQFLQYRPYATAPFAPWQLITYGFLHDVQSLYHIGFNMLGLWMFGRHIEPMMGPRRFFIYYITCVIGAGLIQMLVAGVQGDVYPTVGASGGLMGILLAYAMAFPNQTIMLLIPPIPMKAKYFVTLFALASIFLGVSGAVPGVAHFAHLGGMLFGFLLWRHWYKPRRRG